MMPDTLATTRKARKVLELKLEAAATPARVAAAAHLFHELLEAHEDLPPDSVTLVVSNYDMRVRARAQNEAGALCVGGH